MLVSFLLRMIRILDFLLTQSRCPTSKMLTVQSSGFYRLTACLVDLKAKVHNAVLHGATEMSIWRQLAVNHSKPDLIILISNILSEDIFFLY